MRVGGGVGRVGFPKRLLAVAVVVGIIGLLPAQPAFAGLVTAVWDTPVATSRPGDPVVGLTFDDGPDPKWTPQVLGILRRYGVPATFFVVGRSVAAHPALVRAAFAEGHSVQNHTWDHVNLTAMPADRYPHQIDDTTRAIEAQTGEPVRCARPPYGAVNSTVVSRIAARNLTTVTWSVDPSDYQRPGSATIAGRVLGATKPGAIILLHDAGGDRSQTVAALPTIIEGLLARGFRFTSLCRSSPPRYVGLLPAPTGYWLVRNDGRVDPRGGAASLGSVSGPARPLVGGSTSPSVAGYWVVGADGGVFAFGDAFFGGSLGGVRLNAPVVGMAATPSGRGYWMVGADGGIFGFGEVFFGDSLGGVRLNAPVVGMAATPSGRGYWMVGADGGIFGFGDAFFAGSLGGVRLNAPVVGMAATPTGRGYWLMGADGGVFAFGDAGFFGGGSVP